MYIFAKKDNNIMTDQKREYKIENSICFNGKIGERVFEPMQANLWWCDLRQCGANI